MRLFTILLLAVFIVAGCQQRGSWSKHNSGLEYLFYETNTSGENPGIGDIVVLSLRYETTDGKIIDESPLYRTQVAIPAYEGDFNTGLQMLQTGDSVCFRMDAADFFEKTRQTDLPKGLERGDQVLIFLRLKKIIDAQTLEKERRTMFHTDLSQEISLREEYLERTNVTVDPTESGLYILQLEEGSGIGARAGNTLSVHYTGKGIDGRVFDTSLTKGKPLSFVLGRQEVIAGWDEGLVGVKKGGKVRLIIPSSLAYGSDGYRDIILPYSTLIFDIEVVDIK